MNSIFAPPQGFGQNVDPTQQQSFAQNMSSYRRLYPNLTDDQIIEMLNGKLLQRQRADFESIFAPRNTAARNQGGNEE